MALADEFALLAIYVDSPGGYAAINFEQHSGGRLLHAVLRNRRPSWICGCGTSVLFDEINNDTGHWLHVECVPVDSEAHCCDDCECWQGAQLSIDHELYSFPTEATRGAAMQLARGAIIRLQDEEDRLHRGAFFHLLSATELATYRASRTEQ